MWTPTRVANKTEIGIGGSETLAEARASRTRHDRSVVTIASARLAPCSPSSMLSASRRPGRRPRLRALTTPARGTVGGYAMVAELSTRRKGIDAEHPQA